MSGASLEASASSALAGTPASAAGERRIVALVLPEILCELAAGAGVGGKAPLGVVMLERLQSRLDEEGSARADGCRAGEIERADEIDARTPLDAVNATARRFGVAAGQHIAEARALVAGLVVREVAREELLRALGRVAEVAFAFGITVAITPPEAALGRSSRVPDTVWLDITGVSHLFGGEEQLVMELVASVRDLGHLVRVGVASGPLLAQAIARWAGAGAGCPARGQRQRRAGNMAICPPSSARGAAPPQLHPMIAGLPTMALPIDAEQAAWLVRVGIHTFGDLAALPRSSAAARLDPYAIGARAELILDLCTGRDTSPLVSWSPPRVIVEESRFEDGVEGIEPLKFVLRGLCARVSARLAGRGEAAQALVVTSFQDRSVARLRGSSPTLVLRFELAAPLWREDELRRTILARLEKTELGAPSIGIRLEVPLITRAAVRQLDFSRVAGGVFAATKGLEGLPVLLSELGADIGKQRVGVLREVDSHRPESQSRLVAADSGAAAGKPRDTGKARLKRGARPMSTPKPMGRAGSRDRSGPMGARARRGDAARNAAPTRLLPRPIPLSIALRTGCSLFIDARSYSIEAITFVQRLDAVEWWSQPTSRDYFRLRLRGTEGTLDVLVYVDRETNARFLQAIYD